MLSNSVCRRHDHRRNMRKWLSLEGALKRFRNISTTWKIQRIQQVCCAIPVISPRRKHQIQSHAFKVFGRRTVVESWTRQPFPRLIQNELVERSNTSYMMIHSTNLVVSGTSPVGQMWIRRKHKGHDHCNVVVDESLQIEGELLTRLGTFLCSISKVKPHSARPRLKNSAVSRSSFPP